MAFWSNWLRREPIEEAAPVMAPKVPERVGFEYGVPRGGLTEYDSGTGATQMDRRSLMQQLYEAFLACPWSWACVNAIARTITAGGLVVDWDQDNGEGDQEEPQKPAQVLALERLMKFVNPREDVRQLMRSTIADLLVFGDAYIEVTWVGNLPVALYTLDSPTTTPLANEHGEITGFVQITEFGQRAEFEPREVIHISLDSPRSGVFGVSPTQAALLPITAWLFTAATLKETFRKGNPPPIHVDMPQGMNTTEINRWHSQYMARNVGPRNIGVPLITKGGATVKELQPHRIQEYLHTLDQKRDEILACYGTPPAQATIIESGNLGGGTADEQRKTFEVNTCAPIAQLLLEKINYAITQRGFGIVGWHLKFGQVDMRDSEIIEKIRDLRIRNGLWTLNKGRTEIGEPPSEGGDNAVLIDRMHTVRWRDMDAFSKSTIALNLKGTNIELDEPGGEDTPVVLLKTKPSEVAGADVLPNGQPLPPGGQSPNGKAPNGQPPGQQKKAGESFDDDREWLRAAWIAEYQKRRDQALEELPDDDVYAGNAR